MFYTNFKMDKWINELIILVEERSELSFESEARPGGKYKKVKKRKKNIQKFKRLKKSRKGLKGR